ncbi:MAG: AAA family ATPase [Deltaproteobacteria bacterium]|nr:AAA family ATPase [Deltaproteobacteria bacterium]
MPGINILLTGPPRCGKSTLIEKIISRLARPATGFFTREIREKSRRVGFEIVTLDGKRGIFAHESIHSRRRVGKYGVDLDEFHRVAAPSMIPQEPDQIIVIDEIGKMECFSEVFRRTLVEVLDGPQTVLGSIALKGDPFIEGIKRRPDVDLVIVTQKNRDLLTAAVVKRLLAK